MPLRALQQVFSCPIEQADLPACCWDPSTLLLPPASPSLASKPRFSSFLLTGVNTSFDDDDPGENEDGKGIDGDQQEEWGDPFFKDIRKKLLGKIMGGSKENEAELGAADLEPSMKQSMRLAVQAKQAAWAANRAAAEAMRREVNLQGTVEKADHAWDAVVQAVRVGHAQRLLAKDLKTLREDRAIAGNAVQELVGNIKWALESKSVVDQGTAVENIKLSMSEVDDILPTVQEALDKVHTAQKLLDLEVQESMKYPLFPMADNIVAETPEATDPESPEVALGTLEPLQDVHAQEATAQTEPPTQEAPLQMQGPALKTL